MKLAEALLLKSDLRKRIEQLNERLIKNALVQEGDTPGEDTVELLGELDRLLNECESLTNRIYTANQTDIPGSGTLADLLVQKKYLTIRLNYYKQMTLKAGYAKKLFVWKKSSPQKLYPELQRIQEQLQQLDAVIQQLNWQVDL